jgi:hypothetical protein
MGSGTAAAGPSHTALGGAAAAAEALCGAVGSGDSLRSATQALGAPFQLHQFLEKVPRGPFWQAVSLCDGCRSRAPMPRSVQSLKARMGQYLAARKQLAGRAPMGPTPLQLGPTYSCTVARATAQHGAQHTTGCREKPSATPTHAVASHPNIRSLPNCCRASQKCARSRQ